MAEAKLISVIQTYQTVGDGTIGNPHRRVPQLFLPDGTLLMECDSWYSDNHNVVLSDVYMLIDKARNALHDSDPDLDSAQSAILEALKCIEQNKGIK